MTRFRRWSSLKGYVIIRVTGIGLEGWVNRVVRSGIPLWEVSRPLPDTLIVRVRRADVSRLRKFRGRRVRYRVLGRLGAATALRSLRRRQGLVVGAAACLLALYLASSFLWFVEVEAPRGLDPQTLLSVAAQAGLRPGQRLDRIDPRAIERRVHLELPEVAWANVELRGTRAVLHVAERPGWADTEPVYGHVVADRDGVIAQLVVFRGEPAVEVGHTVAVGDVLISGIGDPVPFIPDGEEPAEPVVNGERRYERADGQVYARVWYDEYGEAALVQVETERTGRMESYQVLHIGPYALRWGAVESGFDDFIEERRRRWHRGQNRGSSGLLRARWETVVRHEVVRTRWERGVDEAIAIATARAEERIDTLRKPDSELVERRVDVVSRGERDGYVRVRVLVEAREDIASFERIHPPPAEDF